MRFSGIVSVFLFVGTAAHASAGEAAVRYKVLYGNFSHTNGCGPEGTLLEDKAGNLYGTASSCGPDTNAGAVFKVSGSGKYSILYAFCAQTSCVDGSDPFAGVIMDKKGNLYGTTFDGGVYNTVGNCAPSGCGTAFKLAADGSETVLHSFGDGSDGQSPADSLVMDEQGNLFGTTEYGGTNGKGIVFEISAKGTYSVLYNFCSQSNCVDGAYPLSNLVVDKSGNLFGTTEEGGTSTGNLGGTVFKLSTGGSETVLANFDGANGYNPYAGLTMDSSGNLYGTTRIGGANNSGAVFEVAGGTESVLYSFCPQANCPDGLNPQAGVLLDKSGNLYGTTYGGGTNGYGSIFKVTPGGAETVLHSFCASTKCKDGSTPDAGLFQKGASLYGVTIYGGKNGLGTLFRVTP